MIDISGIDKADLLAGLFNRAGKAVGMGVLQADRGPQTMDRESALKAMDHGDDSSWAFGLKRGMYFDYLYGRCLKIDIGGDAIDPCLFDRDYGEGAAAEVVRVLCRGPGEN